MADPETLEERKTTGLEEPSAEVLEARKTAGLENDKKALKIVDTYKKVSYSINDILIGRSIGARALNYDVFAPDTGDYFNFAEGTRIQDNEVFAGKGVSKPLKEEVAQGLSEQIGGKPENWQHVKGKGILDYYGEERKAEVHWFQEESVGKHKFKIKEWID